MQRSELYKTALTTRRLAIVSKSQNAVRFSNYVVRGSRELLLWCVSQRSTVFAATVDAILDTLQGNVAPIRICFDSISSRKLMRKVMQTLSKICIAALFSETTCWPLWNTTPNTIWEWLRSSWPSTNMRIWYDWSYQHESLIFVDIRPATNLRTRWAWQRLICQNDKSGQLILSSCWARVAAPHYQSRSTGEPKESSVPSKTKVIVADAGLLQPLLQSKR